MVQESGSLEPALDIGLEGGGHDYDVASIFGNELKEFSGSLDQVGISEVLLYLGPCHSSLQINFTV